MSTNEPRYIDEQRTIAPLRGPLLSPVEYASLLQSDFDTSYSDHRDVWTHEAAMRQAPIRLHGELVGARHVLDVGAGRGRDTAYLLEQGHRVTAIDLVAAPEWATLKQRWGDKVCFHTKGLLELEGTVVFDAVLDNGCLHHQHPSSYPSYLARLHALLRPSGLFTISVFHTDEAQGQLYVNQAQRLYREFSEHELIDLLEAAGFARVDSGLVPRTQTGLRYLVATTRKTLHRGGSAT